MKKLNPYLVKNIEKMPETYTVSYFNEAEWNKGLTPEEISQNNEIAELQYQDNLLNGIQVGPGNETSKMVAKVATGVAITATTIVCPPAGVALAGGITGAGATMVITGAINEDDEMASLGMEFVGIGATGALGGGSNLASHAKKGCTICL